MFGILNIAKPRGWTSRQVVNRVERLVRPAKAGHAGTLDPLATGVLLVCVGQATRLVEYLHRLPKRYRAQFLLGRTSPSDDLETEVTLLADARRPTSEQLAAAAAGLTGAIWQRPPVFSAIKVKGRRAYALARSGEAVSLSPRRVVVHDLSIRRYAYPELELDIDCGSGTYVRSLGRDLARAVGSGAVMAALVRRAIGSQAIEQAVPIEQLRWETLADCLLPPLRALEGLPTVTLDETEIALLHQGRTIDRELPEAAEEFAAVDAAGHLVALVRRRPQGGVGPVRNFSRPD